MPSDSRFRARKLLTAACVGIACSFLPMENTAHAAITGSNYCGSGTSYYGAGPAYKLTFTGNTYPGNPQLGINQYKEYHVWANAYYQWYYLGTELHAC